MTREEATTGLHAFGRAVGHSSLGLDVQNRAGVLVGATPLYFEFSPQDATLDCAAEIYGFHEEPGPGVLHAIAAEAATETRNGGGTPRMIGRVLCLARQYDSFPEADSFARDMAYLVEAANFWQDEVLSRAVDRARVEAADLNFQSADAGEETGLSWNAPEVLDPCLTPDNTPGPAWGTPDPDEQILWAFGQQDYRFCIERVGAAIQTGSTSYLNLQLLLISLQRTGAEDQAAALGTQMLAFYATYPWFAACLGLTLGKANVDDVLALASSDTERWRTRFYEWSRALTMWQRQTAFRARRECMAIDANPSGPVEVPERPLLEIEASHFTADGLNSNVFRAAGVDETNPKREMSVFVSSTFRDLQVEREALALQVFPEMRALSEARNVQFRDVDLRWGITNEQAADGDVLPLCLEAIDACRPYFIGILGTRYGWRPEAFDPDLLSRHPWLAQYAGRSVTEIEFRYGVFNAPGKSSAAFYLRADDGDAEQGESAQRLAALRDELQSRNLPVRRFDTLQALVGAVRDDLRAWLDRDFPIHEVPNALEREFARHEALAVQRTETYVGRWDLLAAVDSWAIEGGRPLIVTGGGRGVTSFLAEWGRRFRRAHPHDVVVLHFVGASDAAGVWRSLVAHLLGELSVRSGIQPPSIDLPSQLPQLLLELVKQISEKVRVVIVIDGLHELDPIDSGQTLDWLPHDWPKEVRLILSSSSVSQLQKLRNPQCNVLEVPPLSRAQRILLIREYLQGWSKALDDECVERLVDIEATGSPIFVRVLLEELRHAESHEALPALIDRLAAASDLGALLQQWLERLERKHGAGLMKETMCLLYASRRGRSEEELCAALGEPLPQRLWMPLSMDLVELLRGPQGRLWLPWCAMREAVRGRYLPDQTALRDSYIKLERSLSRRPLDALLVRERPDLLRQAEDWPALAALLTDPSFFAAAWIANPPHIKNLWTVIEEASPLRRSQLYRSWWEGTTAAPAPVRRMLAQFFTEGGLFDLAHEVLASAPAGADAVQRAAQYGESARLAYQRGDLDTALTLFREQESILTAEGSADGVLSARANQSLVLKDQAVARNDEQLLDVALGIQQEVERRSRELIDDAGVAMSLGNQGVIYKLKGNAEKALQCHDQELSIYGALGDPTGRLRAQANRAAVLFALGRMPAALQAGEEAIVLARRFGQPLELASSLHNQAEFLRELQRWADCRPMFLEAAELMARLGQFGRQALCLASAGEAAQKMSDADGAIAHYAASERAYRAASDLEGALAEVENQAMVLHVTQHPEAAIERFSEAESLARQLRKRDSLVRALANRASLLVGPLKNAQAALPPILEAASLIENRDPEPLREFVARLRMSIMRQAGGSSSSPSSVA